MNNTFGETCNYWLTDRQAVPHGAGCGDRDARRYRTPKVFHVSPFMPMDIDYQWFFSVPGEALRARMDSYRQGEQIFSAWFGFGTKTVSPM